MVRLTVTRKVRKPSESLWKGPAFGDSTPFSNELLLRCVCEAAALRVLQTLCIVHWDHDVRCAVTDMSMSALAARARPVTRRLEAAPLHRGGVASLFQRLAGIGTSTWHSAVQSPLWQLRSGVAGDAGTMSSSRHCSPRAVVLVTCSPCVQAACGTCLRVARGSAPMRSPRGRP